MFNASLRAHQDNLTLVQKNSVLEKGLVSLKAGIFRVDSLSHLLFTMPLNPPTREIQRTGYGYQPEYHSKIRLATYSI